MGNGKKGEVMLVLMVHGSRDARWQGSLQTLTEKVEERLGEGEARLAFMQFASPTLEDVITEAVDSGYERIRILPLFMASAGHVEKDIKPLVDELALRFPGTKLQLLSPVGEDILFPSLIEDIAKRTLHRGE